MTYLTQNLIFFFFFQILFFEKNPERRRTIKIPMCRTADALAAVKAAKKIIRHHTFSVVSELN
jgi:hypothetical protein